MFVAAANATASLTLRLASPQRWGPDTPSLYQATVETSVQCYCEEMREQQRRGPAAKGHHALWLPGKA